MPSKPYVTALIDTYNQGKFIEEAIDSVLGQDYPASQMEILVVDDGSTDDTRERVAKYGDRIRYIYKSNGGQATALNVGFTQARGEIIALLDGDDVWYAEKVRRVCECFAEHQDAAMVYHPLDVWSQSQNKSSEVLPFQPLSGYLPSRIDHLLRFGGASTSGAAFRRESVEKLLPIPTGLTILADTYLCYLIIFVGPVYALEENLTKYRIHSANLYSFHQPDKLKEERRWKCFELGGREGTAWLLHHGYDIEKGGVALYIKRGRLFIEALRFRSTGATRLELFRHLREQQALYRHQWSRRYRMFRSAQTLVGLFLGYRLFQAISDSYSKTGRLVRLRERVLPTLHPAVSDPLAARSAHPESPR